MDWGRADIAIVVHNIGVQITHDLWSTHIWSLRYHLQYIPAAHSQCIRFVHDKKLWLRGYLMSHSHEFYLCQVPEVCQGLFFQVQDNSLLYMLSLGLWLSSSVFPTLYIFHCSNSIETTGTHDPSNKIACATVQLIQ